MNSVTCHMSVSLDGYAAGPRQGLEHPLGEGGDRLHEWFFGPAGPNAVDADVARRILLGNGAYVMGRGMFGGGGGTWDPTWRGWWGDEPPYRSPVFVLTHHEREPLRMDGGTTFTFITGGVRDALEQARAAAGDLDVAVAGGARTVQQFLAAGLLDELHLHIAPVVLGAGIRLLDDVGDPALEPIDVGASPAVTHISYRVIREEQPDTDGTPGASNGSCPPHGVATVGCAGSPRTDVPHVAPRGLRLADRLLLAPPLSVPRTGSPLSGSPLARGDAPRSVIA